MPRSGWPGVVAGRQDGLPLTKLSAKEI